jgi:hypothetical protein
MSILAAYSRINVGKAETLFEVAREVCFRGLY